MELLQDFLMWYIDDMEKDEFDARIQAGLDAVAEGRVRPAMEVFHDMAVKYGIDACDT